MIQVLFLLLYEVLGFSPASCHLSIAVSLSHSHKNIVLNECETDISLR